LGVVYAFDGERPRLNARVSLLSALLPARANEILASHLGVKHFE